MKKIIFIISIFVLFYLNSFADPTGILKGYVKDKVSGEPIEFARVEIKKIHRIAATDAKGYYEIRDIRFGFYDATVSCEGYEIKGEGKIGIAAGIVTQLNISLEKKKEREISNNVKNIPGLPEIDLNPKIANSFNEFSFDIFKAIYNDNPDNNQFISPISIQIPLTVVLNGAVGRSYNAIKSTLHYDNIEIDEINFSNKEIIEYLNQFDFDELKIQMFNSLWFTDRWTGMFNGQLVTLYFDFKKEFLKLNTKYFNASLNKRDFSQVNKEFLIDEINEIVKKNTNGIFKNVINDIGKKDIAFIINTIYFKGLWDLKFDKAKTEEEIFYLENGDEKRVPLMFRSGYFKYFENNEFQAIKLPYIGKRICMYVFLPSKEEFLEDFVNLLNNDTWTKWQKSFHEREGEIKLPRFKFRKHMELKKHLKKLGMGILFNEFDANLSKMIDFDKMNYYIKEVIQDSFIEVNEEGTEASAVTSVKLDVYLSEDYRSPKPFKMHVTRPYFFAIIDEQTGLIIFIGSVKDPLQ